MRQLVRLAVVAAALVATAPTAAPAAGSRIVGGQPASRGYEYAAALKVSFPGIGQARCAGALISARHVVTAAHCLMTQEGARPNRIQVALGNVNYDTAAYTEVPPGNHRLHPDYTGQAGDGFDVAVIELPAPVANGQLRLLRPADAGLWAAGTRAVVIGWGMTDDGQPSSATLLEADVPIHADDDCDADLRSAGAPPGFFKPDTMLCAGGKDGRDACNGDSGGPLLVGDGAGLALAGLVSFGVVLENGSSCAEGVPGIYSRVGAERLNSFVRSVVPQVEIDRRPAQPRPGDRVTLTAVASKAAAYDGFAWDLDGDGAFDDATGSTAAREFGHGTGTVAVRAARGDEAEVRRIPLSVGHRSPVAFARESVEVAEGRLVRLRLLKDGRGAGQASLLAQAGTASLDADLGPLSAPTVSFRPERTVEEVTIRAVDDSLHEGPESFTVELAELTGDLIWGDPPRVTVTVVDDEAGPRIALTTRRAITRAGRFALGYSTTPGRVVIRVQDAGGGRTYGRASRRHGAAGRHRATIRLNRAGRSALRRRRAIGVRVSLAIVDGADVLASSRGRLRLRR